MQALPGAHYGAFVSETDVEMVRSNGGLRFHLE